MIDLADRGLEAASRYRSNVRERQFLQWLNSANVPRVALLHGYGHNDMQTPYLATDYNESGTMSDYGDEMPDGLEVCRRITSLTNVAMALCGIKDEKIIHGDVKPANIFRDGTVFDFSVSLKEKEAQLIDDDRYDHCGVTYGQCAPEAYEGFKGYEIDVWGLGNTIYRLMTGRSPHVQESTAYGMYFQALQKPRYYPDELNSFVPSEVSDVAYEALNPGRFSPPTIEEMYGVLYKAVQVLERLS